MCDTREPDFTGVVITKRYSSYLYLLSVYRVKVQLLFCVSVQLIITFTNGEYFDVLEALLLAI